MSPQIKKFLLFGLKALVLIVVVDFALGKILAHLYNRMTVGEKARANYFIRKDTSSVVVFGSSRALYHYHSGILADSLKMTVYNAGRSNQTILYHTALLQAIVKRHVPKIVILDVSEDELIESQKKYELLSALLPYYKHDKDIRKMYDLANPEYKYFSWMHTLPYNSSLFATLYRGLQRGKDKDIHGFLEHAGQVRDSLRLTDNCNARDEDVEDPNLRSALRTFMSVCRERNVKLFVVVSPRFVKYKCDRKDLAGLERLLASEQIALHNYASIIPEGKMFADPSHLNAKGAEEYSMFIGSAVREWKDSL